MELVELITIRQDPSRLRLVLIIWTAVCPHTAGNKEKKERKETLKKEPHRVTLLFLCAHLCVGVGLHIQM